MTHVFVDYPASGPDQGIVKDISPSPIPGSPAATITNALKSLYDKIDTFDNIPHVWDLFQEFPSGIGADFVRGYDGGPLDLGESGVAVNAFGFWSFAAASTVTGLNASALTSGTLPIARGGTGVASNGGAGNVLFGVGTAWAAGTPDAAGLVDKASTQTISGTKTFASPVFTGVPIAPTATTGTNTTQLATTAFVIAQIASSSAAVSYTTLFGDGTNNTYTITHNLGTRDVMVQIYEAATPYSDSYPQVDRSGLNTCTITYAPGNTPGTNQYKVLIRKIS